MTLAKFVAITWGGLMLAYLAHQGMVDVVRALDAALPK
jgi:hypothetical protein